MDANANKKSPMTVTRRGLLATIGATVAADAAFGAAAQARSAGGRIKAVGFDAFTIFDPRSVVAAVEDSFPGKGNELAV